jgi:hypothetical protein
MRLPEMMTEGLHGWWLVTLGSSRRWNSIPLLLKIFIIGLLAFLSGH